MNLVVAVLIIVCVVIPMMVSLYQMVSAVELSPSERWP